MARKKSIRSEGSHFQEIIFFNTDLQSAEV